MTPSQLQATIVRPALTYLPSYMASRDAEQMLITIALHESDKLRARRQYAGGPARGWWQFELGGVLGVYRHHATAPHLMRACADLVVPHEPRAIYDAIEWCDLLAGVVARLNLWWLPVALPSNVDEGWWQYLEAWRPGAYTRGDEAERAALRKKWGQSWDEAEF